MAGYHIYSTLWLSINFKKQISFVKKATDSCSIDRIRSKLHGRCTFFHVCGSRSRWFSFDSAMKQEDSWSLQRSKSTQNGTSRAFSPPSSLVSFLSATSVFCLGCSVFCLVSCVLCGVSCVLCLVCCVFCLVSCVLCLVMSSSDLYGRGSPATQQV